MKNYFIVRNTFRGILLISLIFRLFFIDKTNYCLDIVSYISLGIGLAGVLILELIIFLKRLRK